MGNHDEVAVGQLHQAVEVADAQVALVAVQAQGMRPAVRGSNLTGTLPGAVGRSVVAQHDLQRLVILRLHRNERNLGIGNFNRLMELASGDLVVIAHGDDYSRAERVRRIVDIWLRTGASMIVSNWLVVDARGRRLGYGHPPGRRVSLALRDLAARGRAPVTLGAVLAWQRRVFDEFGPLDAERSAVTTDYILPFRAALLDGIAYVDVPLVGVRSHDGQKHSRYLGDKHDALAAAEGRRANQMMQGLYMLDTLDDAARRRLKPAQTLEEARALVHRFLLGVAHDWRTARNGLYASGRRARWLALEP